MDTNLTYKTASGQQKACGIPGAAIGWRRVPGKGRGVFALRDVRAGDTLEMAPVVPIAASTVTDGEPPDSYLLQWNAEEEGQEYAMVMGYVMLYNHGNEPNVAMEIDLEQETVTVSAARDIKAGEELLWNYNCELWFDAS